MTGSKIALYFAIIVIVIINKKFEVGDYRYNARCLIFEFIKPLIDKYWRLWIIEIQFSENSLILLYFEDQRVSEKIGILGISFLRKVLSRYNLIISLIVPVELRITIIVFKSLITKFNWWLARWKYKVLLYRS